MTQDRNALSSEIERRVLETDIAILDEHNVSDDTMSLLAAEHAARVETLSKMIEPSLGRAFLLVVAGALLSAAKQIDAATTIEPEVVHA